jgi:hypothetical protein
LPHENPILLATRVHTDGRTATISQREQSESTVVIDVRAADGTMERVILCASFEAGRKYVTSWLLALGHDCQKEHCADWQAV